MEPLRRYKDQIIAGTAVDGHGEKYSKEFFESLICNLPEKMPLNQQHDMSLPVAGYLENYRIVPSKTEDNEWSVIADISITEGNLSDALKGFSFSSTQIVWGQIEKPDGYVFVPFPAYNDEKLITELLNISDTQAVGKWIKKGLGTELVVGLLATGFAFGLAPEWDILYRTKLRPKIVKLFCNIEPLNERNVSADFSQRLIGFKNEEIQAYFIPDRMDNSNSLTEPNIYKGLNRAISYLSRDGNAKKVGVNRITLVYEPTTEEFVLHNIIYLDGSERKIV
jgi:hypothetical protein